MKKIQFQFLAIALLISTITCKAESEDILQLEINEYHSEISNAMKENSNSEHTEKFLSQLEELKAAKLYVCTNGIMPSQLTPSQYLEQFAKGPCSPTVALPGIMGSKLVAEIECEAFQKGDPETFSACGWTGCGFMSKKPEKEYQIWIPSILSPASLIKPYGKSKRCFSGLFGLKIEGSGNLLKIKPKDGIKISTLGSSPVLGTKKTDYQCGWDAIEKLLPLKTLELPGTLVFTTIKEVFLKAGYKIGVSLQALPYDFRLDVRENDLNKKFPKVVNEMYEMFGKRVTIIAHSFGNFQTAHYLWNLPQAEKDKKIARYIALAPPFGGAVKPLVSLIGMDSTYSKSLVIAKVGLTEDFFTQSVFKFKGIYNLLPQNTFQKHKDRPYIQAILQKIDAEKKKTDPKKGTIMDLFPPYSSTCVEGFWTRYKNCVFGMTDMTIIGSILGNDITYDNLFTRLSQYSHSEDAPDILKQALDPRFTELENLGIQTNIVFSASVDTYSKIHYKENPRVKTNNGNIYDPDTIEKTPGDGSVLASSALIAGIKWADEFQNQRTPNSKPVVFIEVCSSFNQRDTIFQDGGNKVLRNEYIGVDCSCKGSEAQKQDPKCASHTGLVEEPKVVELLLNSVIQEQSGEVGARFKAMSGAQVKDYEDSCRLFNSGV